MRDLSTIIGSKTATSFKINDLYVPADAVSTRLHDFCAPALMHNDVEGYSMSKSGSLVKCRLGESYFVLTAAHNLSRLQYSDEQLCLHSGETGHLVTSNKCVFLNDATFSEDHFDVRAYDFSESVEAGSLRRDDWFNIANAFPDYDSNRLSLFLCIGYPGELNEIDYEIPNYPATALLVDAFETKSHISGRRAIKLTKPMRCPPAGISGAPIFGLGIEHSHPNVFLCGIVTDASRDILHYTEASDLAGFTKRLIRGAREM